jgi:hypothetical protein
MVAIADYPDHLTCEQVDAALQLPLTGQMPLTGRAGGDRSRDDSADSGVARDGLGPRGDAVGRATTLSDCWTGCQTAAVAHDWRGYDALSPVPRLGEE